MALIFLGVLILFTVSSFEFQPVRLPGLHRYWWVARNSPDLRPLDYQVWEQCWSLIAVCNRSQKEFLSLNKNALQLIWSALPE